MRLTRVAAIAASLSALAMLACSSGPQPARVEAVEVRSVGESAGQLEARVSGSLPEGCSRIGDVSVDRSDGELLLTLPTEAIEIAGCEQDVNARFIEFVPLPLDGLEAGSYVVRVGDAADTFELEASNVIPPKEPGADESITGEATVESVTMLLDASFPIIHFGAKGHLPDSCTTIESITQRREANSFIVTMTTTRPADGVCAQVIVPFDEVVSIDTTGLGTGTYAVYVNDIRAEFSVETGEDKATPSSG